MPGGRKMSTGRVQQLEAKDEVSTRVSPFIFIIRTKSGLSGSEVESKQTQDLVCEPAVLLFIP